MRMRRFLALLAPLSLLACREAAAPDGAAGVLPEWLGNVAQAGGVAVAEGVWLPPQVKPGQLFQAAVTLRNGGGAPVTFEEIVIAVLKPDGTHLYDAGRRRNITVAPGERWHLSDTTSLYSTVPPGTYAAVARGRVPGGGWFNFPVQGGTSPATLNVVAGPSFAAVVLGINVNSGTVVRGSPPWISANIRNTSSPDTPWGGAATFWVKARVSRNGLVVKQQEWQRSFSAGELRAEFGLMRDYDTSVAGLYEVVYQVYTGDNVHHLATRHAWFWVVESLPAAPSCNPPPDGLHKIGYVAFSRPPYGFAGATPWFNVVHDTRLAGTSTVEIDYVRLWVRVAGTARVVSANDFEDGKFGGKLCRRSPWYGEPCEGMPGTVSNGMLVIEPGSRSDRVWHPYLETYPDPRVSVAGADSVWMEVRFRISGPALVQVGLDYWKDLGYPPDARLEEAGATDWYCNTGSWQTVKLEPSTTVADSIRLSTSPEGTAFRIGTAITGSYTLLNADDDTVWLREAGLEIRRNQSGFCDPARDTVRAGAMAWATNLVLPPGASRAQASVWTPSSPGTYCVAAVESRRENSYQRTRARTLFKPLVVNP